MRVRTVRFNENNKVLRLENGSLLTTHRYCCLGPGDNVIVKKGGRYAYAKCRNGLAQVLPTYLARDAITLGNRTFRLTIKEPVSEQELHGYHQLEDYHYRGKILHGRRVPLIVCSSDPLLPKILGYIELSTAFLMNRPRAVLLDAEFRNGPIQWNNWKKQTVRRYANAIVRIARCVVSPEFRGIGLAQILVRHAARYARKHWNVGGLRPEFIEITADMLRYAPFVERAGMHYVGDTEGNLSRVNRDMNYILKNFARVKKREILKEESAGIVDLQVFYATQLQRIQKQQRVSRKHLLALLLRNPQRLSDYDWNLLHRIYRLPKPTFVAGLNPRAHRFLKRRIRELDLPTSYPAQRPGPNGPRLKTHIELRHCSLTLKSSLIRTRWTRRIQQAFGVSSDMLATKLFSDLSFSVQPGEIVLLCGPSGAGKTTLLSLIGEKFSGPNGLSGSAEGRILVPKDAKLSVLGPPSATKPLINSLGPVPFDHALFALNVSGLAEAHLYVKRFRELSNGQRYRAMVAKLIASDADIWIADEFCATLDPITSGIVCRNLRRCAKHLGVTVIVAAANWKDFVEELRPDLVVHLRSPWESKIFRGAEFCRALSRSSM